MDTLPPASMLSLLRAAKCDELQHLDATMESHLLGTYANLIHMGARRDLCIAGLFHALDGTHNSAPAAREPSFGELRVHIGSAAFELIEHYVHCCRDFVWPQFQGTRPIHYKNRFTGSVHEMGQQELEDFCALTTANELQIFQTRPGIWHPSDAPVLAAISGMQEFLTPQAWQLYESVRAAKLPLRQQFRRQLGQIKRALLG